MTIESQEGIEGQTGIENQAGIENTADADAHSVNILDNRNYQLT